MYVYEREESTEDWNLMSQVISSGVSGADMFGYSVSVCKDYAVVGAPNEDGNGFNNAGICLSSYSFVHFCVSFSF